jgi:hypothetical protein
MLRVGDALASHGNRTAAMRQSSEWFLLAGGCRNRKRGKFDPSERPDKHFFIAPLAVQAPLGLPLASIHSGHTGHP